MGFTLAYREKYNTPGSIKYVRGFKTKRRLPHSEADYHKLVALLDSMIVEVGEDESHPLASLMEIVGVLIEKYEDEHMPEWAVDDFTRQGR